MKSLQKSNERWATKISWLNSFHSFSFADYYNPQKMGFGPLRVINDDTIQGGSGFAPHHHANMEIISIPLQGVLVHGDCLGNKAEINTEMMQVMSAGTGIVHSEFNLYDDRETKFLQIWIEPNKYNIPPRHVATKVNYKNNDFTLLVSPSGDEESIQIFQEAYLLRGKFDKEQTIPYASKYTNASIYIFVISGEVQIGDTVLQARDGLEISDESTLEILTKTDADFLLFDMEA